MPRESPNRSSVGRQSHIPRPRMRSSSHDSRGTVKAGKNSVEPGRHKSVSPKRNNKRSTFGESKTNASKMSLGKTPQKLSRSSATPGKSRHNLTSIAAQSSLKDNRPLQDKIYQSEMVVIIENFFQDTDNLHVLNNNTGSLKPMTLKIFVDATNTLFQIIKIPEILTMTNYIDYIPTIAKKLYYPGAINKSWLKTANAPHAWPYVLGWLSWLTILTRQKMKMDEQIRMEIPFKGSTYEDIENHRRKYTILTKMYELWNEEKYAEEKELMNEYFQSEEMLLGINEENKQKLGNELARAKSTYEEESRKFNDVFERNKQLKSLLKSLEKDEEELNSSIKSHENEIEILEKKDRDILKEIGDVVDKQKQANVEIENLRIEVSKQPISVEQRDKMLEKLASSKNYYDQIAVNVTELNKQIFTVNLQNTKLTKSLSESINEYNRIIYQNEHNANTDITHLELPLLVDNDSSLFETIKEKINFFSEFDNELIVKLETVQANNEYLKNEIQSMKDELVKLNLQKEQRKEYQKKIEKQAESIKQMYVERELSVKKEIAKIEDKKNRVEPLSDLTHLNNNLKVLEEKVEALQLRKAFIENKAKSFFTQIETINKHHVDEMEKHLDSFQ